MPALNDTSVRVPAQLAAESEAVLRRLGLSMDEAVRLFLSQVALQRGLPFAVALPREEADEDLLATPERRQSILDSFYDDTEAR